MAEELVASDRIKFWADVWRDLEIGFHYPDVHADVEGQFDAIWDRGSLVALDRTDVPEYISVIKNVLSSKGRILLEVMEYDVTLMKDTPHPPPHPMYEEELKSLYEPECEIEFLERTEKQISGKDVYIVYYCIIKLQH